MEKYCYEVDDEEENEETNRKKKKTGDEVLEWRGRLSVETKREVRRVVGAEVEALAMQREKTMLATLEGKVMTAARKAGSAKAALAAQKAAEDVEKRAYDAIVEQAGKIAASLKSRIDDAGKHVTKKLEAQNFRIDDLVADNAAARDAARSSLSAIEARRDKDTAALRDRVSALEARLEAAEHRAKKAEANAAATAQHYEDLLDKAAGHHAHTAVAALFDEIFSPKSEHRWTRFFDDAVAQKVDAASNQLRHSLADREAQTVATTRAALTALGTRSDDLEKSIHQATALHDHNLLQLRKDTDAAIDLLRSERPLPVEEDRGVTDDDKITHIARREVDTLLSDHRQHETKSRRRKVAAVRAELGDLAVVDDDDEDDGMLMLMMTLARAVKVSRSSASEEVAARSEVIEAALAEMNVEVHKKIDESEAKAKKRCDTTMKKMAKEIAAALSEVKADRLHLEQQMTDRLVKLEDRHAVHETDFVDRFEAEKMSAAAVENDTKKKLAEIEAKIPQIAEATAETLLGKVQLITTKLHDECALLKTQLHADLEPQEEKIVEACRADVARQLDGLAAEHAVFVQRRVAALREVVDQVGARVDATEHQLPTFITQDALRTFEAQQSERLDTVQRTFDKVAHLDGRLDHVRRLALDTKDCTATLAQRLTDLDNDLTKLKAPKDDPGSSTMPVPTVVESHQNVEEVTSEAAIISRVADALEARQSRKVREPLHGDDDDDDFLLDDHDDDVLNDDELQRERDIHVALKERIRHDRLLSHVTSTLRDIADS